MNIRFLKYIAIVFVMSSCNPKLSDYLKHSSPVVHNFDCVANCYQGNVDTSLPKFTSEKIYYANFEVDKEIVYYDIPVKDSSEWYMSINLHNIFHCFMIFKKDSIFLLDKTQKTDIKMIKLKDFQYSLPNRVKSKDTILIAFNKRKVLLYNFHRENLKIDQRNFKCYVFEIIEKWPDTSYNGKVWLDKKYGIIKRQRTTAKVEVLRI